MKLFKFLQFLRPAGKNQVAEANIMDNESAMNRIQPFIHNDFSLKFCPEAKGHFCMLWGDHGHGGYDSTSGMYEQGGQPMDDAFEFASFYYDFKEARTMGDWRAMRAAIQAIRHMRDIMEISIDDERYYR